VFVFNADLPPVDNLHNADRVIECSPAVYEFEAPWRIDFPQGTTIRGTPEQVGQWPTAVDEQPPNFRVLTLAASGEGEVVADNSGAISSMLADYNAAIPTPAGRGESGGFCSVGGPVGGARSLSPAWLGLLLGVLLHRARRAKNAAPDLRCSADPAANDTASRC
jgi:hypothetical protein